MIFNPEMKQLNPFEIKAEINRLFSKYRESNTLVSCDVNIKLLDAQQDKKSIIKLLLKELMVIKPENVEVLRFLLERYSNKQDLTEKLWNILNEKYVSNEVKLFVINFLRDIDTNWSYEKLSDVIDENELLDSDTQKLLTNAIANPEVQIDFLDFLNSLQENDKITLINSLGDDYSQDELANILIPVFLSQPESEIGQTALELLGDSKSQLAFHALNLSLNFVSEKTLPILKKNISKLKMAGVRTDNSSEFYKNILSISKPYRFCITFPDGHGNSALIFSRINEDEKIQFVAIVINDYTGVRDCFGFNEISKFECDTIITRFYKGEKALNIQPKILKDILNKAEQISRNISTNHSIPYEYICWKNLINDIEDNDINYTEYLKEKLAKRKISDDEFQEFCNSEATSHWFLDSEYSTEFESCLYELNNELKKNIYETELNAIVDKNLDKIFDEIETNVWTNRVILCSYLYYLAEEKHLAEIAFNIYANKREMKKLFKHILKRSIYEYYFALKYDIENKSAFSRDALEQIVKKIEVEWVNA